MPAPHLTPIQRGQLQSLLEQKVSTAEVARRLGRHRSTIYREIQRNGGHPRRYHAASAQKRYDTARKDCVPGKRLEHQPLWEHVIDKITRGWTPEEVAGQLPLEYPEDRRMRISHEALYQAIYGDPRLHFLIKHLAQARPKRRKRGQGKSRRGPTIPNRVGIEKRPHVVEERSRFGDWEGDTVVGAGQDAHVVTLVDRKSRRLEARKVKTKQADEVAKAVVDALEDMPVSWVRTITFDNGTEFTRHEDIAKALEADIYFAAPYASYQRGTNENTNGLLRRYLPKGTGFKNLTAQKLQQIVEELNNRPRKCLGYRTPNEVFQRQRLEHRVALRP